MTDAPNSGAPYIDDAQAQKAATHNRGLDVFDAGGSQLCVQNRTTTAPPGGPALGQAWIVAAGGSGAWNTHDGQVAAWYGGWVFLAPKEGWLAYDRGADEFVRYDGAAWGRELGAATGWVAATGTATRTTFDTATVTLAQLAEHFKALLDDLLARKLPHT
jgi:hypothetical protein